MSKEVEWGVIHGEGTIYCECDECGSTYEYEFEDGNVDYRECQAELKEEGWISRNIDGEWYDFCCLECFKNFMR